MITDVRLLCYDSNADRGHGDRTASLQTHGDNGCSEVCSKCNVNRGDLFGVISLSPQARTRSDIA